MAETYHIFFNFSDPSYYCYDKFNPSLNEYHIKPDYCFRSLNSTNYIYIFYLQKETFMELIHTNGYELNSDKLCVILNCLYYIYPNYQEDIHIILLNIILHEETCISGIKNLNFIQSDNTKDCDREFALFLSGFEDPFLYSLYLYQLYLSKILGTKNFSKIFNSTIKKIESLSLFPKLSYPIIYKKKRFHDISDAVFNKFISIYKKVLKLKQPMAAAYIFSLIYFPDIHRKYNEKQGEMGSLPNVSNDEKKDKKKNTEILNTVTKVLMKRIYADFSNVGLKLDIIKNFFNDYFDSNELYNYLIEQNEENSTQNNFPFDFSDDKKCKKLQCIDQNINSIANFSFVISPSYLVRNVSSINDLTKIIGIIKQNNKDNKNENDIMNDLQKYNNGLISDINPRVFDSMFFKYLFAYIYFENKSDIGNPFLFAEKYTYDFYNFGAFEYDLENIPDDDPSMNALCLIIEDFLSKSVKTENDDNKDEDDKNEKDDDDENKDRKLFGFYKAFFGDIVQKLLEDGLKILNICSKSTLEIKTRIEDALAIAYKFKAKKALMSLAENKDNPESKEKDMFENIVSTIKKEEANLQKNNNEFIKMFNLRGTYYHLFFIIAVKKVKLDEQLLSYFYTIMESLDELYIGYLVQSLCNEGSIAENLQNFINKYL